MLSTFSSIIIRPALALTQRQIGKGVCIVACDQSMADLASKRMSRLLVSYGIGTVERSTQPGTAGLKTCP